MAKKDLHNVIDHETLLAQELIASNKTKKTIVVDTALFMANEFLVVASEVIDGSYVISLNESDEADFTSGVEQAMSRTVDTEPTADGNITLTITATQMFNSPKAVIVAILDADDTDGVATKIRAGLAGDADVARFFDVSGEASEVILTAKVADEDDAAMEFAFTDTGTTGADLAAQVDTAGVKASVLTSGTAVDSDDLLVTAANLTITSADTGKSVRLGYRGPKRYIELQIVSTGVTSGATFNVLSVNGHPNLARTDDDKA